MGKKRRGERINGRRWGRERERESQKDKKEKKSVVVSPICSQNYTACSSDFSTFPIKLKNKIIPYKYICFSFNIFFYFLLSFSTNHIDTLRHSISP